jgi:hypothetical protein
MTKQLCITLVSLLVLGCYPAFAGVDHPKVTPPANVAGKWQVSWTGRLGTEKGVLTLKQEGQKVSGTFDDLHGSSPLEGKVDGNKVTYDVQFAGKRPYTIDFTGTVNGDKIDGTSQAKNVGGNGAYLGHGGEVVQPERPWSATRIVDPPAKSE